MSDTTRLWRDATQDDYEFLYSVLVAVRSPEGLYNEAFERERYARNFNLMGLHVVQHEGKDVGRFKLLLRDDSIDIELQILPAFQRLGIGSAIIHYVMHDAAQMDVDVALKVHELNVDAQRLYQRLGFVPVGRDPICKTAIRMRFFTKR